jgi:hypothetical protein
MNLLHLAVQLAPELQNHRKYAFRPERDIILDL